MMRSLENGNLYDIILHLLGRHVTKIELELKEAPDGDAILIESMPSELNVADEINTTYTNGEFETSRQRATTVYLFLIYPLYIHEWSTLPFQIKQRYRTNN